MAVRQARRFDHAPLIEAAGASDLVTKTGWKRLYRDPRAFDAAATAALRVWRLFGVETRILDGASLSEAEPALRRLLAGGLSYEGSWAVRDPGALVDRYCRLFEQRGGAILVGDAGSLRRHADESRVHTSAGEIAASVIVSALGPWADRHARALGYRFPMFVKRGYHRHHRCETMPRTPMLDAENGVMLAPMANGLRITTGAEFAALDAPPTPIQLAQAEARAAELVALGPPCDAGPWMGARPCSADMLPIVGSASRHEGLWFNFGHGHQGLTLAAVTGRLLAELICGAPPIVSAQPYAPDRFATSLRDAA